MPPRDFRIRIRDIITAAEKIISNTQDMDFESFSTDDWTIDAVLRNITVIGEAAGHIPDEVCNSYPDIPWREIRDMRNIIVHEYFGVDLGIIWNAIRYDLPKLIPELKKIPGDG